MLLEFCVGKEFCASNTYFQGEIKRKLTFRMGGDETEVDFVLIKRTSTVYKMCESNPFGVSTCISGCRHR